MKGSYGVQGLCGATSRSASSMWMSGPSPLMSEALLMTEKSSRTFPGQSYVIKRSSEEASTPLCTPSEERWDLIKVGMSEMCSLSGGSVMTTSHTR